MPPASVRTGAYAGSVGGERDERPEERRVLGDDHVAGVDDQLGGQVEALLTSLDDQHVVGGAGDAVPGESLRDLGAQVGQAVGGGVLQGDRALRGEQAGVDLLQLVHREQRRVGIAAAEGDDLRIGAQPQQLADGRRLHAGHPAGEPDGRVLGRRLGGHEKASRLSRPASVAARCSS
jgi:hypothetical protein